MGTTVIMQPTYLPWLGYFELISQADTFVFLDTVQCENQSWQTRNRIIQKDGKVFYLTVPIKKHPLNTPLNKIEISYGTQWYQKHFKSINQTLGNRKYFNEWKKIIWLYYAEPQFLTELTINLIMSLASILQLHPKWECASKLDLNPELKKTDRLLEICKLTNTSRYYSPIGAKSYIEENDILSANGIVVDYQNFKITEYEQNGKDFISHLSVIDALVNVGPEKTLELITGSFTNEIAEAEMAASADFCEKILNEEEIIRYR